MILTRLDEILKEKNISINKLSNETGISRNALTSLVNNDSKGIQFQTLDKLITYLDISIQDFFRDDRESLLISVLPIQDISNPIYNFDDQLNDSSLVGILYMQSLWNLENDNEEDVRYNSSPILTTPFINNDKEEIFGISFNLSNSDSINSSELDKNDLDNFLFIFYSMNKDQLHFFVLHLLTKYVDSNKRIRELIGKTSLNLFPVTFTYFDFNELLIFNITKEDDGGLLIDFDFSSEKDENEKIRINTTNVDLSKYLN